MPQTGQDFGMDAEWKSLNALSGIPVGEELRFQLKGNANLLAITSDTPPASDSIEGAAVTCKKPEWVAEAGSLEVWVRTASGDAKVHVWGVA